MSDLGPWAALGLLGVYHGVNPAMGWLFAVALGLQERRLSAVLRALVPIAVGHELSVLAVALLVSGVLGVVESSLVRAAGAVVLVLFGLFKLLKPRSHPRWVGMRVTLPELGLWSFLMSSAHGAGLMLLPILMRLPPDTTTQTTHAAHAAHLAHAASPSAHAEHAMIVAASVGLPLTEVLAVTVHTATMFLMMVAVALLVFDRLGLAILRRAWFNLDRLWAGALILSGALVLLL